MQRRSKTNRFWRKLEPRPEIAAAGIAATAGRASADDAGRVRGATGSASRSRRSGWCWPRSSSSAADAGSAGPGGLARPSARLRRTRRHPEQIEAVAEFGRAGAWELLRIFSTTESEPCAGRRAGPGASLARRPARRRGGTGAGPSRLFGDLEAPVGATRARSMPASPSSSRYEVPFLPDDPARCRPDDLEWSHRIVGARRAPWKSSRRGRPGRGDVGFSIIPDDFPTNGPHRLVLQTRVRTAGLSDSWEIELPHVPFKFEFDPVLRLDAILTLSDAVRDETIDARDPARAALAAMMPAGRFAAARRRMGLRNPPRLAVTTPLPSDLAHAVSIEFDGHARPIPGGLAHPQRPGPAPGGSSRAAEARRFDLGPIRAVPDGVDRTTGPPSDAASPRGRSPARLGRPRYPLRLAGAGRDELGRGRDHSSVVSPRRADDPRRPRARRRSGSRRPPVPARRCRRPCRGPRWSARSAARA